MRRGYTRVEMQRPFRHSRGGAPGPSARPLGPRVAAREQLPTPAGRLSSREKRSSSLHALVPIKAAVFPPAAQVTDPAWPVAAFPRGLGLLVSSGGRRGSRRRVLDAHPGSCSR